MRKTPETAPVSLSQYQIETEVCAHICHWMPHPKRLREEASRRQFVCDGGRDGETVTGAGVWPLWVVISIDSMSY